MIDLSAYRPCVGVVLARADGLIFAGQRSDRPEAAWQMPQGGIDPGEDAQTAALRELEEETGVAPSLVRIEAETPDWVVYDFPAEIAATRWGGQYLGQKQRWFLVRFTGTDADVNIATEHPEFSAWDWVTPAEMLARIVPFKRAVYAEVLGAFAARLAG